MRVALVNDGMYPYRTSVGGTWCHRLVRGLPEHAFHLVTITDRAQTTTVYYPPTNTLSLTPIVTSGPSVGPSRRRPALQHRRAATHAAVLLCRSMLEDTPHSVAMFRSALRRLTSSSGTGNHPLHGVPLGAVLFDAWQAANPVGGATLARAALPRPTIRDAEYAAELLQRAVRPLATVLTMTEMTHATDVSLGGLVAVAQKWRTGAPFLVTEHRPYVEAPILDEALGGPVVRGVMLRFVRALARLTYMEAARIVAPNEAMRHWALEHGAEREKVSHVPYGVDPHSCTPLRGEPTDPAITFLGPERDLPAMLTALATIRATPGLEAARLIVAGPASAVAGAATTETISFLGPVTHRRSAYATGQIVVVSGRDDSMPYGLIEAMMCGRPTVAIDDEAATVAPMLGLGGSTVPRDDPAALAAACVAPLSSPDRRRQMSQAAGQRARNLFGLRMVVDRYREIYGDVAADSAGPTGHLTALTPGLAADLAIS